MSGFKDKKNKQVVYIVIIIVMVVSTVFILLKDVQKNTENRLIVSNVDSVAQEDVLAAAGIVDDDSLETILNTLVRYGNWPVESDVIGRSNPFVPVRQVESQNQGQNER